MKFKKGQKVVCLANYTEWTPIKNDAIKQTNLILGNIDVPQEGKVYKVDNPMTFHYDGICYISLIGHENAVLDERAFEVVKTINRKQAIKNKIFQ